MTECSEILAYKIQVPGNYPEENIQHTEHTKSLKSRIDWFYLCSFRDCMSSNRNFYSDI